MGLVSTERDQDQDQAATVTTDSHIPGRRDATGTLGRTQTGARDPDPDHAALLATSRAQ